MEKCNYIHSKNCLLHKLSVTYHRIICSQKFYCFLIRNPVCLKTFEMIFGTRPMDIELLKMLSSVSYLHQRKSIEM